MKEQIFFLLDSRDAAEALAPDMIELGIAPQDIAIASAGTLDSGVPAVLADRYRTQLMRGKALLIVDLDQMLEPMFTALLADRHPEVLLDIRTMDAA